MHTPMHCAAIGDERELRSRPWDASSQCVLVQDAAVCRRAMEDLPFTCPARVQRRAVIYDSMRRVRKRKASWGQQLTTDHHRAGTPWHGVFAESHGRCTRLADRPRVFRLPLAGCADSHRVASPCAQNSARASSGRAAVRGSGSRVAGSAVCVREDERGTAIKL